MAPSTADPLRLWDLELPPESDDILEAPPRLTSASAGDHAAIFQLYTALFASPSRDAFYASLDDPFYEPRDRLVVRRGSRIVAHVHRTQRVMHFGGLDLPVAGVFGLGTLPEFRHRGYGRALVQVAEQAMAEEGALLGLLSTRVPHFFRALGWAVCGRQHRSEANTRSLLSQLSARGVPPPDGALTIRPWRQVELPALMRVYAANTAGAVGPYQRSEAFWRWLLSRQGIDNVLVAIQGPDRFTLEDCNSPIVGYCITLEERILELMTASLAGAAAPSNGFAPPTDTTAEQLLARACGEAIERDFHRIVLHAPPGDRLHDLFRIAGGTVNHQEAHQGEVFMAKVFDPAALLKRFQAELQRRAEEAGLGGRSEIGFLVGPQKFQLAVSRRGVKLGRSRLGRSYLRLNEAEFTRLLLGHLDLDEAVEQGRVEASTRLARQLAAALFPRLPLWRPPWDDVIL